MRNSFVFSVWAGAVLYAAVGLFGVVIFHGAGPITKALTDGYGIAYAAIATSEAATSEARK